MPKESSIEKSLVRQCKAKGIMCLKLVPISQIGFPDRTLLRNGRVAFVEVKKPGGKVAPQQKAWHRLLAMFGCPVWVVSSVAEFDQIFERFE